jgi:UDP-N-acetylmuramate dehydrogenase
MWMQFRALSIILFHAKNCCQLIINLHFDFSIMKIQENIALKKFNSFGVDAYARYFSHFSNVDELKELITYNRSLANYQSPFILGGGSNILFIKNVDGLVLKNEVKGIELIREDENYVYVRAGAGENWHSFVQYCLKRNWAGLENLSLIPGNVGAGPMQNIGAYGVELKGVFYELETLNIKEQKVYTFSVNDCQFGYRDSVFKERYKNRFIITTVTFRLYKKPRFNTSYGAIEQELNRMGVRELSIQAISQAVINIRSEKLPDPAKIGNAGSFFKNPSVPRSVFEEIKSNFPGLITYENADGTIKLGAGWLIEQCGWKGFRRGDAGCNERQALVLVNFGNATGKEIYDISEEILLSVRNKFGILLEREVNIV